MWVSRSQASGPYLDPILQLVDDEEDRCATMHGRSTKVRESLANIEGPVVGAAAYAVSQLMDGRNGRLSRTQRLVRCTVVKS